MRFTIIKYYIVLGLCAIAAATGCSRTQFTDGSPPAATSSNTHGSCTGNSVADIKRLTKILFVVDTSGSNVLAVRNHGTKQCLPGDPDYDQCTPPSDPEKHFRVGSIRRFLDRYYTKQNFQWGLMNFSGTSAHALITDGGKNGNPRFTANAKEFETALDQLVKITDYDATPYQAALQLVQSTVRNDPDLNSDAQPDFDVVFITDGYPTDYDAYTTGILNLTALTADITALEELAPHRVHLSTIYYSMASDTKAVDLLRFMATLGTGQSVNANGSSTIDIDDLIRGKPSPCP